MNWKRYHRQIIIPFFGEEGQKRLEKARVIVIGAGGLGSPVITYLAAAGVGRIGVVDHDKVEVTNLNRQTIHAGRTGENKAISAVKYIHQLNPEIEAVAYPFMLSPDNILEIFRDWDVVVSCVDSMRLRYLINDACFLLKKPMIHAAVFETEGEAITFTYQNGSPCYRCIYPRAIEHETPGIFGFTAGFFGTIQAAETIKLLSEFGDILEGRMIRVDLASMEWYEIKVRQRDNCELCSGKIREINPERYGHI
ncbi:HesA/MoeB/ThiF family protein [Geoglobus acetivorans]|uniref:Sulfur carrier protein adenylyltransferase ThiF n=1 Tax=Geoglobus acetivorans TaxID=565033 RepID=A0A0A7GER3_GEOAI|nr:Sulfur carrier protein adenylyltransferase ThiF [Geoglobus acetivorans]